MSAHVTRKHARLSASAAYIWTKCTGAPALWATVPPRPSGPAAEWGTACHELAELVFKETPNARYYIGKKKFNGFDVDEEMAECAQTYVDHIRVTQNRLNKFGKLKIATVGIETAVELKHLHPDMGGTADAYVLVPGEVLHVLDLKTGQGIVEPEENPQLMIYAIGTLKKLKCTVKKVVIHVVQPRAPHPGGPIRQWETTPERLLEYSKFLKSKAAETEGGGKLAVGDHCEWCNAAAVCPAVHQRAVEVAKADFADDELDLPDVKALPVKHVAKVIEHASTLRKWLDAVEEYATQALLAGQKIPGVKLVAGRNSRAWASEDRAAILLMRKLKLEAYTKSLLTPAAAEKVFKQKGFELEELHKLIETKQGDPWVASKDDKRPEWKSAKLDFDEVSEDDF